MRGPAAGCNGFAEPAMDPSEPRQLLDRAQRWGRWLRMAAVAHNAALREVRGVDALMSAPREFCCSRSVVAVLASGVVISLTALTAGVPPAFAKPDADQVVMTTVPAPEPTVHAPEETEAPSQAAPPVLPAAPSVEAPPPTQEAVEPPPPPATQSTTAPVVTSFAPASPTAAPVPPATTVESPAPRVVAPPVSDPSSVISTATSQSPATQAPSSLPAPAATSAPPSASAGSVPPSAALVAPSSAMDDMLPPSSAPSTPSSRPATPGSGPTVCVTAATAAESSAAVTTPGGPTVSVSQAAKVIETSEPRTLEAPKADVELARNAKPVEVKPDPAPKQDVDALSSSIGPGLGVKGPLGVDSSASAKVDARLASDRVRDRSIRQWSPDWVQYDEYYRPILINPYHERVRISTSTTTPRGSCGSRRWRGLSSKWRSSRRTASPLSSTPRPTLSTRRSTPPSMWRSARSSAAALYTVGRA